MPYNCIIEPTVKVKPGRKDCTRCLVMPRLCSIKVIRAGEGNTAKCPSTCPCVRIVQSCSKPKKSMSLAMINRLAIHVVEGMGISRLVVCTENL